MSTGKQAGTYVVFVPFTHPRFYPLIFDHLSLLASIFLRALIYWSDF